jgi:hypothetical protein
MTESRPGKPGIKLLNQIVDSIPIIHPPKERIGVSERPSQPQFSLFLPKSEERALTYRTLMGTVTEISHLTSTTVGETTSEQSSDIVQIPIGASVGTLPIPDTLGGLAYRAMIPIGIDALSHGNTIVGAKFRREGNHYIAIYGQPFPEMTQVARDNLFARYTETQTILEADDQLIGAVARQDFTDVASQIEMNKLFHAADGRNPAIEDLLHRFGSFDMRLLFPVLQEFNASSLSYLQLQTLYPERLAALREGYITMDRLRLEEVPEEFIYREIPTLPVHGSNGSYLPSLASLYNIYELKQAGFDIKLTEAESPPDFIDADKPTKKEFAIMAKPL